MTGILRYATFAFAVMLPLAVSSQDTVLILPVISVEALPLRQSVPGEYAETWTSHELQARPWASMANVLSRTGGLFVRNYGPGTLAMPSIRGGSASQTAILWNGVPIQSPMLGLADLSLLPVVFADRLSLQYGSSGARWGSGAVGGALHIDQVMPARLGWGMQGRSSIGSFGHQLHTFQNRYRTRKWASVTRFFSQQAINDFPYSIRADLPGRRQQNARVRQVGVMQELYWMPGAGQEVSAFVWWQQANRQIPPLTTQTISEAYQRDNVLRTNLHWRWQDSSHTVHTRLAWNREEIDFRDPQIQQTALSDFAHTMVELEHLWKLLPVLHVQSGVRQMYSLAHAGGYDGRATQIRTSLFTGLRWTQGPWMAQTQLMQEWMDGQRAPIQPEAGLDWNREKTVSLHARVARHYRLPTLNDLYWSPGGNPDLQAEHGWSQELGVSMRPAKGLSMRVNGWRRHIQDWIMWTVSPGQFYWSARNITAVRSYGLEGRLDYRCTFLGTDLRLEMGWDLLRSLNQVAIQVPRIEAGADMPYTPRQQGFAELGWEYHRFSVYYTHRYTGGSKGFNEDVSAFDLGWAGLAWSTAWFGMEGRLFFEAGNVWNRSYRIVERRPMPGRSLEFGLLLNYHKFKL